MSTKIVHTCKAPDGTEFKRVSASGRKYTHAVVVQNKETNQWACSCWNSRRDLAQRHADSIRGSSWLKQVWVVEAKADEIFREDWKTAVYTKGVGKLETTVRNLKKQIQT